MFLAVLTRLADLIGKRPIILIALMLVLIGCVIGSVATTLPLVILGRVLIGATHPYDHAGLSRELRWVLSDRMWSEVHPVIQPARRVGYVGRQLLILAPAWHAFFVVSAVIALVGLVDTVAFVKDSPARAKGGLDVPGAALLTATMVALLAG